ncbi:MAG: Asp-tRNA(Asn)/Glu-tRNA(Gln) amidotransferase subunit GatB [Saprospiraceae bacterium]|nr:Asp-tRNA(Asn)/Glu-tRNA(Gln) amidotransferase subunit GatB [Saprospiraceae bacterium]
MSQHNSYEPVIGLEIHVQLNLESKAFAREKIEFGNDPNHWVSPISLGLPGTLPVANKQHIESALKLGIALHCDIANQFFFDRKHYFYADLPKGYQISQHNIPYCTNGFIPVITEDGILKVPLVQIHMEEDAGKSIHDIHPDYSLLDYNRAGAPLLEIVTEPVLHDPKHVSATISTIQQIVQYLGISDGDMEKGQLRCDCNVSLRPMGSNALGTKCEIKNVNSKRFARKAIEAEIKRQVSILQSGGNIVQSTLNFDPTSETTTPTREKETAHDYRYMPEPDMPAFEVTEERLNKLRTELGLLPEEAYQEFILLGLQHQEAYSFIQSRREATFLHHFLTWNKDSKGLMNLYVNQLRPYLKKNGLGFSHIIERKKGFTEFQNAMKSASVSRSQMIKDILPMILKQSATFSPSQVIEDLSQTSSAKVDGDLIESKVTEIINQFPDKKVAFQKGKKGLLGFFMGQAMRQLNQKVNPQDLQQIILKHLNDQS